MDIHIFAVSSASSKIMSCAPTTSTTEDTVTIEKLVFFPLNTCFLSYTCFLICYVVIASDRPILIFYNRYRYRYLYIYVTDNRYSEPIFINCYKVNK